MKSVYKTLRFPSRSNRPFFYASFVSTVDGKVYVKKEGYWPIGSKVDYDTFTFLRAHADAIIDGKQTAIRFGLKTIETIHKKEFQDLRKGLSKNKDIQYFILTSTPNKKLAKAVTNPFGFRPNLVITQNLKIPAFLEKSFQIVKLDQEQINVVKFSTYLYEQGFRKVFIDGGPHLFASFLAEDLVDEIFLTISPKIVGNKKDQTLTMVEGKLFPSSEIKQLQLLFAKQVKDEIFLRYRVRKTY